MRGAGIFFTSILCAACASSGSQDAQAYRERIGGGGLDSLGYGAPRREWFQLGLSFLDRQTDGGDPIEDGLAFSVDGGFDVSLGDLRPALELGWQYAPLDVEDGVGSGDDEHVDVHRVSMGLRLTAELERIRPYARAGVFYRWSQDDDDLGLADVDLDGGGFYAGCGLDLRVQPGLSFGPFFAWYRETRDDELEETLLGLSCTFYP